jgi:hypothetical protein
MVGSLRLFDSTIKEKIYPEHETNEMISYGIILLLIIMTLVYILKLVMGFLYGLFIGEAGIAYRHKINYAILKDISLMVVAFCIVSGVHHYHKIDWIRTNIDNLLYGVSVFIVVWLLSAWI